MTVKATIHATCNEGLRVYNRVTLQFIGRSPTSSQQPEALDAGLPTRTRSSSGGLSPISAVRPRSGAAETKG